MCTSVVCSLFNWFELITAKWKYSFSLRSHFHRCNLFRFVYKILEWISRKSGLFLPRPSSLPWYTISISSLKYFSVFFVLQPFFLRSTLKYILHNFKLEFLLQLLHFHLTAIVLFFFSFVIIIVSTLSFTLLLFARSKFTI